MSPPRSTAGRTALRLLPALLVLAVVASLAALVPRAPVRARVLVVASVPPTAWLVRRIGGDRVAVDVLLPPGASEHTYEPTPQQVARLADARLVVAVGHPSFLFEKRLLDALLSRQPPPQVVDISRDALLLPETAATAPVPSAGGGSPNGETDPHVWLSPAVMRATAIKVADALARLDPKGAVLYRQHLAGALADIDGTDAELRRTLAGLPRHRFLVYHPAWGYLAHDYGLQQVAIEAAGKEPSPRQLVALIEQARRDGTRTVFVQAGYYDGPARAIASELGARVVSLDPMAEDWPANLRQVATHLREALGAA